ncbi:MAG: HEAT repeat domain-containing protein [Anaerolineae bacterium]|nr:HEAT repeat domain-containing protein [Anaerolineae bacterium]
MSTGTLTPPQVGSTPEGSGSSRLLSETIRVQRRPVQDGRIVALHDRAVEYHPESELVFPWNDPTEVQIGRLIEQPQSKLYRAWSLGKTSREDMITLLIAVLRFGSESERVMAAMLLIRTRELAVPSLIPLTKDENPETRYIAVWILGMIGGTRSIRALILVLFRDTNEKVRSYAATALARTDDPRVITALVKALDSDFEKVRWYASAALKSFRVQVVDALTETLQNPQIDVRIGAVRTLGRMMLPQCVEPLCQALRDPESMVRIQAAEALGWIRDPRALAALVQALQDSNIWVKIQVVAALGWTRDSRVVTHLTALLGDEDEWVVYAAINALVEIGDVRALSPLRQLVASTAHPWVRRAAAHGMQQLVASLRRNGH